MKSRLLQMFTQFGGYKGVKLCATFSGGHAVDDLDKMNVLKKTILAVSGE